MEFSLATILWSGYTYKSNAEYVHYINRGEIEHGKNHKRKNARCLDIFDT